MSATKSGATKTQIPAPASSLAPLFDWLDHRAAGVLLHPTSLPSAFGVGVFDETVGALLEFLSAAGIKYWQLCPLGPTGYGDSPYQCFSSFAGNPYLIDPAPLLRAGLLADAELASLRLLSADQVDFGALYDLSGARLETAVREALALVGLTDRAGHRAGTFSGGMKRRLNLAGALLHGPELLILDEPTVGVDPQSRNAIFENLEALKARGVGLLYTTHYMEEVERLCERVVIIDRGAVVADDTLRDLFRKNAAGAALSLELEGAASGPWIAALQSLPCVAAVLADGERLRVALATDLSATVDVLTTLKANGAPPLAHLEAERPTLESVFLTLTGKRLRDA